MIDPHVENDVLAGLADEFRERYRRGERPALSEYTGRYPELADQILEIFPTLMLLEDVRRGAGVAASVPAPPPPPEPAHRDAPQRLGEYRLVRQIGRGGMGVVYEAEQESLGRRVALKVLPPGATEHPRVVERFRREARAAARLHHTNIVPVFGVGQDGGTQYYVMQYIEGHPLDVVLDELRRLRDESGSKLGLGGTSSEARNQVRAGQAPSPLPSDASSMDLARLLWLGLFRAPVRTDTPGSSDVDRAERATQVPSPPSPPAHSVAPSGPDPSSPSGLLTDRRRTYARSVAHIGVQVADALEYAAGQGILHRDIKPSNLLLDMFGTVWVTDFGLAKASGTPDLTHPGDLFGTLRYLAPERFRGKADVRSDVYALGLTLYELLALRPAFGDHAEEQLIRQITLEEPPRLDGINPELPRDLVTIVHKAIAKDPHDRYQTAGAVAEDLRRFLDDRPIVARRTSFVERCWRWCRRNPGVAASLGSAVAGLLAAVVLALLYADGQAKATVKITGLAHQLGHSLIESNHRLAVLDLERGQLACEQGEVDRGLLWMIESLRAATEVDDPSWQHAVRANLSAWRRHQPGLRAVFAHGSVITKLAISPDGKTILTGSQGGTARLWDASTGRPIGPPLRHQGPVSVLAFSPDGQKVMSGSQGGMARLWDASTGRPIGPPLRHQGPVMALAFSPDGKIALTGSQGGLARLWDASTGAPIGAPLRHQGTVMALAFSPDGRIILTGSWDGTARLWDALTGRPVGRPLPHQGPVGAVTFSPDGKTALTGSDDKSARLWRVDTGEAIGGSLEHKDFVQALTFSPDGKIAVTGSWDGTARLWQAATGKPIGSPLQHQDRVDALAFSPDGKTILTGSYQHGTARLWDAATGWPAGLALRQQGRVQILAFGFDGKTILTGGQDGMARLWDAATGGAAGPPVRHQGPVAGVAFSPDGKTILTGSRDATARLWDAATGSPAGPPLRHQGPVAGVAFSPDGKTVLTGSWDGTARLWDATTGRPIGAPMRDQGPIEALAFSPDGKIALTGGEDGTARLWDSATACPVGPPLRHQGPVVSVAFSPDGKMILTGSRDGTARLWNRATGRAASPQLRHQDSVDTVAFSPNGRTALTGSADTSACLWDVATGRPIGPRLRHQDAVTAVAFSPDGKTVLTASDDSSARLWDATTGVAVGLPLRHQGPVASVAFRGDGQTILTGGRDGSARLWDAATGLPIGPPLRHQDAVTAVVFSPNGRVALTGSRDGTARLWETSELRDDLPRLSALVHVITGLELDERGATHVLDDAGWWQAKERLRHQDPASGAIADRLQGPSLDKLEPVSIDRISVKRGDAGEKEGARDTRPSATPLNASIWRDRARFFAARSLTANADADLARAFAMGDREPDLVTEVFARDTAFRRVLTLQPDAAPDLWLERGEHYVRRRQWGRAKDILTEALVSLPDDVRLRIARGRVLAELGRSDEATADFDSVFPSDASDPEVYRMLADEFARRALWEGAATALEKIIELDPSDHDAWYRSTPLYLQRGDVSGYQEHCRQMLERFRGTTDPVTAERTAKGCLLDTSPESQREGARRLAEEAVEAAKAQGHGVLPYSQLAMALAEYRRGRFKEAREWTDRCLARLPGPWNLALPVHLVRSMALSRLGHDDEARMALSEAAEMFRTRLPRLDDYDLGPDWHDWLICDLLRREAEATISESALPVDPFAP